VKLAARRIAADVPVLQPEKIRTGEVEAALRAFDAALFVVVAYGRILPQAILDLPALGPYNVHASLLPRGRGAAPIQWSIINGDRVTGVSIMRMEAGLDTGPVVARASTPIEDDDTTFTLGQRLAGLGAELLGATLPRIVSGEITLEPQDGALATMAPILRKEDGRLSFAAPAREVSARARGVDPWPGPTASLAGEIVKLFVPRVLERPSPSRSTLSPSPSSPTAEDPGTILAIDDQVGVVVACADGPIAFAEIQLPGRKRLPARAVAAGRAIAVGMRFD
jgi:methionyl-tRNA formyltransferase